MRRVRVWLWFVVATLLGLPAHAQSPQQAPRLSDGGAEMWDLSNSAEPRHWFSGLRCWRDVEGAAFVQRAAYDPTGGDVSCGYDAGDYFITVYATLRRPLGAPYGAVVQQTAQDVRRRYGQTEELSQGPRELATARGPVSMEELVFRVGGLDSATGRGRNALTGVWHIDVAGWTLKLRLTATLEHSLAWMRETADAIMRRAYEDLETARGCAAVGMQAPQRIELNEEKTMELAAAAAVWGILLMEAAPPDPEAARRAGFVCLGAAFRGPGGELVTSVMPASGRAPPPTLVDFGARIVAIGETRSASAAVRRVAVFDMPRKPLSAQPGSTDRIHLVFAFEGSNVHYYGPTFDRPAESGGMAAASILAGRTPAVSVTTTGPDGLQTN